MKNFDTDSHIKIPTNYFEISQFERPMDHFDDKNLLYLIQHFWVGKLHIKSTKIADKQKHAKIRKILIF